MKYWTAGKPAFCLFNQSQSVQDNKTSPEGGEQEHADRSMATSFVNEFMGRKLVEYESKSLDAQVPQLVLTLKTVAWNKT